MSKIYSSDAGMQQHTVFIQTLNLKQTVVNTLLTHLQHKKALGVPDMWELGKTKFERTVLAWAIPVLLIGGENL